MTSEYQQQVEHVANIYLDALIGVNAQGTEDGDGDSMGLALDALRDIPNLMTVDLTGNGEQWTGSVDVKGLVEPALILLASACGNLAGAQGKSFDDVIADMREQYAAHAATIED